MTTSLLWDSAERGAARVIRPGPQVTRDEADGAVAELADAAVRADELIAELTRLPGDEPTRPARVIDRPAWASINIDGFREVMTPMLAAKEEKSPMPAGLARVAGYQLGMVLGLMSSRVLGQFETFSKRGGHNGQLLLVAPNVVAVERKLGVDPSDFRLWVALHESCHRRQFQAVPWLDTYVLDLMSTLVADSGLGLKDLIARLAGRDPAGKPEGIADAVQSPAQREITAKITAVMSLLEGHADYIMDQAGPDRIPTVGQIREKFDARRTGGSWLVRLLRVLTGFDAKLKQYIVGGAFVRAVVAEVGLDSFNRVWESPETLPTRKEIADPAAWIARVGR